MNNGQFVHTKSQNRPVYAEVSMDRPVHGRTWTWTDGRTSIMAGFLPVRTVPVLGLVLHVLLGLELRTALTGTEPREPVLYRYGTGTIIYM